MDDCIVLRKTKQEVIYNLTTYLNVHVVKNTHLHVSVNVYENYEVNIIISNADINDVEKKDFIPLSMVHGIEHYHIDDQMVEIPSSTKHDDCSCKNEVEHGENYFLALGGKPVVVSVAIFDNNVHLHLLSVLEVDFNQVYELMVQILHNHVPIHYVLQEINEEGYAGFEVVGTQAKMRSVKITINVKVQLD